MESRVDGASGRLKGKTVTESFATENYNIKTLPESATRIKVIKGDGKITCLYLSVKIMVEAIALFVKCITKLFRELKVKLNLGKKRASVF